MNPLYDFVFLNLEGSYDAGAVKAMAEGLRSPKAAGRKTLHRAHPADREGWRRRRPEARVKEILDAGADGVTIPHIRSLDEAKQAIGFFRDAKANVWSPSNPRRRNDRDADARGSGRGGAGERDRRPRRATASWRAASAASRRRSAAIAPARKRARRKCSPEAKRAKLADMLTANTQDVAQRVKEGFLALLMQGPTADEAIKARPGGCRPMRRR